MKNYVKVFRAIHNMTQAQLAEKLGVSRATINAIEKGRYDPSLKLAFKMARLFNVTIESLFEDEETPH
ncbi:MAG TPA: helix-turn-helix transcriptional regulator [Syntrophomonadaceae bacterium]|nr:helix-turn-helix transcriptional regulator [Syntrophomonadaceae bacterium]HQD91134.1 helix-turn-helix transcriptional regulator [Syntrophomonadaceae bacterium]